jgi:transcriptional regulator with XRE-family HTH domain
MDLGQKIVTARRMKGLTQEQLADLANITVRTIQRIERNETTPRPYTLQTIATALNIPFETLIVTATEQQETVNDPTVSPGTSVETNGIHFLQMLCLSCFTYLVIPFVHFLVPNYLLKKSNEQNPKIVAFARRVIRVQLFWKSALWLLMLLTLAYNIIIAVYFQRSYLLNYLVPFFIMYFLNAILITSSLLRIKKVDFALQPVG